jgi:hypothetical protein
MAYVGLYKYIRIMNIKGIIYACIIVCICSCSGIAQQGDFCKAINTILKDAPNKFRNLRGKELQNNPNAIIWECGVKAPGSLASRFVVAMGLFYEGAFLQTQNKADVKPAYDEYKALLSNCLLPQGFKLTYQENFYPGMGEYKKLAFMPEIKPDATDKKPPPHVTMEATYSKALEKYTLVIYIFEH